MLLSLTLITVYFREPATGGLHDAQGVAASALRPFEVAVERVSRPFRDAYGYVAGLVSAKAENERLRARIERLEQQVIQDATAADENADLRALLNYRGSDIWPKGYDHVAAQVLVRPASQFAQQIVIDAGWKNGVRRYAPVVTEDGLVGSVTKVGPTQAQVTLLIDETAAVSAEDFATDARGVVTHGAAGTNQLIFDRVTKEQRVERGDGLITAGWRSGDLESQYPRGIPIGEVTNVGRTDTDDFVRIQVEPYVDFSSLDSVLVLLRKKRPVPLQ